MSSGVLDLGIRVPKQKRVYSKGGCRECKRRKIKCDEGKPFCWQCVRLRKECSYPAAGEKVLRVSRKKQQETDLDESDDVDESMDSYPSSEPPQIPVNDITSDSNSSSPKITNKNNGNSSSNDNSNVDPYISKRPKISPPSTHSSIMAVSPPQPPPPQFPPQPRQPPVHPLISSYPPSHHTIPSHHNLPSHHSLPQHHTLPSHHMLPSLQLHNRLQPQLHHGEVNGIAGKNINIPGINNGNGTISRLNNSLALGNHTVHNPQDHHHHHQQQHQQISHQEVQQIAQQSLQHQHQHHPHIAQINISRSQGSEQDESPSLTVPPIRELHQAALQQPFPQNSIQHQQQQPPSAQSSVSSSVSSTSSIPPNSAPHVHKYTTSSIANLLNDAPTPAGAYTKTQSSSSLSNTFSNSPHSNASTTPTNSQHEKFQEESPNETVNNSQVFPFFDQDDLNLLASDLNNIVSNIMYELNFDNKYSKHKTEGENNDITFKGRINDQQSDNVIPRNIPIDYLPVKKSYEKIYLEEFYNEFSQIILPFSSYDAVSKTYFNPARDIILKSASNESFLLAAVLAQGAKLAYQKNNVPEDEEAYCTYLSKCLKLLGPALANGKRGREALTSNIEAILLTVLLLTAANAANSKQDWRAHLKGAKDILLKTSANKVKSSKILIFCKSWFVTLEVLAGISSKLGGTLTSEEEMDMLISSHDEYENSVLKELGIILDNGFNIMGGYHNDCVSSFRELTKLLARKRNQGKDFQQKNSMDFIKLFSEFYKQSEIEFINKKCMLSPSDFENGVIPHGPLVDVLNINSETVIISWMDTSHQSYVLASMITILTNCFQEHYNSPQVQFLTNKIISFVSFLSNASEAPRQMIKCALMMVSWPMLVAGINCEEEDCKYILMKFFRISSQVGSGGAGFALRRISNIWKRHEKGISDSESEDDKSLDLVSY